MSDTDGAQHATAKPQMKKLISETARECSKSIRHNNVHAFQILFYVVRRWLGQVQEPDNNNNKKNRKTISAIWGSDISTKNTLLTFARCERVEEAE